MAADRGAVEVVQRQKVRERVATPPTAAFPVAAGGQRVKKPGRLQFGLQDVVDRVTQQPTRSAGALASEFPRMRFVANGEKALVSVEIAAAGDPASLADQLVALGAQNVSRFGRLLSARVPVDRLNALAGNADVKFARPVLARTRIGSVQSQGDFALRAPLVRPPAVANGLTGAGVEVGVLSDSYDCLGGESADLASGDIAAPVNVLKDLPGCSGAIDEGRGMAQLIADVAPGSSQSFYTAFDGQADFANGILALAAGGADVIVDDVIYFAEPMFLDGIIAQAADQVVADGVPYFSSAGNQAVRSYEAPYSAGDTGYYWGNGPYHDFGGTNGEFQSVFVRPGEDIWFWLQWDDAFFSADPGSPGASTDVDIFLFDLDFNLVASGEVGNVGGDPVENLYFFNDDYYGNGGEEFYLYIEIYEGPVPSRIKYVDFGTSNTIYQYADVVPFTDSGTVYGKAAAAGAFAAGAAFFGNTPECGTTPALLEGFSSHGGTPTLRQPDGTPITPVVRQKPDAVGPDGGNTTFFGSDTAFTSATPECDDSDSFPNFFGTSASAPHLAAVAALMLEKNPAATPAEVYDAMRSTASDMLVGGPDFASGFGYVHADAAIAQIEAPAEDTEPDAFDFEDVTVDSQQAVYSNTVTISGINAPATLTLSGNSTARFIINGGSLQSGSTTVNNGDTVRLRMVSPPSAGTRTATVDIGGVSDDWRVTNDSADTTPDAFDFVDKAVVGQQAVFSNIQRIRGINAPVTLTLNGHSSARFSINGGPLQSGSATVNPKDFVRLRLVSSPTLGSRSATVEIGGVSDSWTVTTEAADTVPDAFDFEDVIVSGQQSVFSNIERIDGINTSTTISLSGHSTARFSINGGSLQTGPATVNPGDTVRLRLISSPTAGSRSASIDIGGVTDTWTVTTQP
ncbi:MAG: S8 family serine peptidase [Sinimarinibacterium flocculans]|uniref:S8 family peptidase n=1 Tax=Sinimarinibacterium flocculans TaxID=985250 RepID=UPI003C4D4CF8